MTKRHPPRTLEGIWSQIPSSNCKGMCTQSCGPIAMSTDEDVRLMREGIAVPPIEEAIEQLVDDYHCPALLDGHCTVYEQRPTVCRLWGSVEGMPCEFGCVPDGGRLPDRVGQRLLNLSLEVGGGPSLRLLKKRDGGDLRE